MAADDGRSDEREPLLKNRRRAQFQKLREIQRSHNMRLLVSVLIGRLFNVRVGVICLVAD